MNNLAEWCNTWKMSFNASKCHVIHYGKRNQKFLYHINGRLLEDVDTEKDLGIYISHTLKPEEQIQKCVLKANKVVGMIRRTFTFIDKDIFLRLYKTFVRPILEYSVAIWSPHLIKDISLLEKVQERATKLVRGLQNMVYDDRL